MGFADQIQSRVRRLLTNREAMTVLVFSGLSVVGGLVGNRVLTQVADPNALGELYLYNNLALWLSLPTAAGYVYVTHHWAIAREHNQATRFARAMGHGLLLQAVLVVLGTICLRLLFPSEVSGFRVAVALAVMCFATAAFQALSPVPNAERRRVASGVLGLMGGAGRQFALALGVVAAGATSGFGLLATSAVYQAIAGVIAAALFAVILARTRAKQGGEPRPTEMLSLSAFFSYSVPAFGAALAAQLATSAERWGLARIDNLAATALFVQAVGISVAATGAVASVLTSYFYPFITDAAAKPGVEPVSAASVWLRRFILATVAIESLIALGTFALSRQITGLVFGPKFAPVAALLPWTVLGAGLFFVGQSLTVVLFTGRDALWPNFSRITSQLVYAAGLLLFPHGLDPAKTFSMLYGGGQALFVGLLVIGILRAIRSARPDDTRDARNVSLVVGAAPEVSSSGEGRG